MKATKVLLVVSLWVAVQLLIGSSRLSTSWEDRSIVSPNKEQQIPCLLHFLWPNKEFSFGDDDPHGVDQRRTLARVQRIQANNPDWETKIWTDDECYALVREHFPDFYRHWTSLTPRLKMWDAVRPAILHVQGGIYLDHDIDCDEGVHFSDWIGPETTLLLREPSPCMRKKLGNHLMGSAREHPLWLLYLKNIVNEIPENYTVGKHTGPRQLYPTFQEYIVGLSKVERSRVRLLGLHEVDMKGECEDAAEYEDYCSHPRCSHLHSVSPAELAGEDDNPEKQVVSFRNRAGHNYTSALCGCKHLERSVAKASSLNESRPVVFIHVPKSGGTTIEHFMQSPGSCHVTASVLKACDVEQYDKTFTFAAIRNPVERIISMYRYVLGGGNGSKKDQGKFGWVKELDFASFVEALPAQREYDFAPQTHFVSDFYNASSLLVNEIICTEDLNSGWERLQTLEPSLKLYGEFPTELVRVSSPNISFSVNDIDDATMNRLREIFHDDFRLWEEHCNRTRSPSILDAPRALMYT